MAVQPPAKGDFPESHERFIGTYMGPARLPVSVAECPISIRQ